MAEEQQIVDGHPCEGIGCTKSAKLKCPTCVKLRIKGSFFCSQECFKANWKGHKSLHKPKNTVDIFSNGDGGSNSSRYDPWPDYRFTGLLRPSPLSDTRVVPDHIQRPDYADNSEGWPESEMAVRTSTQISILDKKDIDSMRTVCRLAREVLDTAAKAVRVGITTDELDEIVHKATIERNCYPSPLNYRKFPKSCCTSVNEAICHGIPDSRPLADGDIVNLDITCFYNGFHGDLNETLFVGKIDEDSKMLVKTAHECLALAIKEVKPGMRYRDAGAIIQKHAQSNGCSVTRSYCGHGIHRLFHTAPNVPHYAKNRAVGVMKPGHVFTIEPMINRGTWRDETWPDDWTAVTQDGKRSAQFEHTLLVTETGCDILTARTEANGQPHFMDQL